jgi:hypothetical protein
LAGLCCSTCIHSYVLLRNLKHLWPFLKSNMKMDDKTVTKLQADIRVSFLSLILICPYSIMTFPLSLSL